MYTTSHFVGIIVHEVQFADLFYELQDYFAENKLASAVTMQCLNSIHITLHYLPQTLPEAEKESIQASAKKLSSLQKKEDINELKTGYFGTKGQEKICYIGCKIDENLQKSQAYIAKLYPHPEVSENSLAFTPHITLFRINNSQKFQFHQHRVNEIIQQHIKVMQFTAELGGVRLFAVNSKYQPELQVEI